MFAVVKALFLLVLDLVFCYLFGTFINNKICKKKENLIENTLIGFFAQQAVFQVCALFIYSQTAVLHHLSMLWSGLVLFIVLLSVLTARKHVWNGIKNTINVVQQNKRIFWLGMLVIGLFCYYAATHGVSDDDAMYYIGLVNTTASTDRMYQHNVYTGEVTAEIYWRRALVTFEIQSAVYAQVFQIHALIITRIFRACENVILTGMAVYLCGTQIFTKAVNKCKEAVKLVVFYFLLQPMFVNTIFTPATFLMKRAYEGKAFTANVIALCVLYQIVRILKTNKKTDMLILVLVCWGSMAVSASAIVLCASEVIAIGFFPYAVMWISRRKERQRR